MASKRYLLAFCLSGSVFAGDGPPVLGEVPVYATAPLPTASLSTLPVFETPLSSSQLPVARFAERLPRDIADVADYAPGVSRRASYWGVNSPTFQLRGFNAGESTAYFKDGFRYQARGAMPMANVEQVEILRGVQSAIYGWLEPGGAVQVHTKQPTRQAIHRLAVQTDSWGKHSFSLDNGGPLGEQSRFRFVAAHEQGGSFRQGLATAQTLLAPSIAWDFAGGRQLTLALEWMNDRRSTDYGIPAINGVPADVPVTRAYTEPWGKQHAQSSRFVLRWQQPTELGTRNSELGTRNSELGTRNSELGTRNGSISVALSYYQFKYLQYLDVEPYAVTGNTVKRWYESFPEQYQWLTGYVDWSRQIVAGTTTHHLTTRLEIAREKRALYRGVWDVYTSINAYRPVYGLPWTPTANYSVYDQIWTNQSVGLSIQDEIVHNDWTWLLGMRVSALRQVFDYADYLPAPGQIHLNQRDQAINPRLGVSWQALPGVRWYANYAAGNMAALPQNRLASGAAFAPIRSRQVETGLKWQQAHWQASLALFDIQRNNVLTPDPNNPGFSIQTGKQGSRGMEMEWQGRIAPCWQLRSQATWLDARLLQDNLYVAGNRLPYTARFGAAAWVSHRLGEQAEGHWQLSVGLAHQGMRYADFANTTRLPAYTRLDMGATYQAKSHTLTVSLENVSDQRYFSSGVENRPAVIYPGAPRTLSFKLHHDFD